MPFLLYLKKRSLILYPSQNDLLRFLFRIAYNARLCVRLWSTLLIGESCSLSWTIPHTCHKKRAVTSTVSGFTYRMIRFASFFTGMCEFGEKRRCVWLITSSSHIKFHPRYSR